MTSKYSIVTGGAGFIGSHLVEELFRLGRTVTVVDDFSNGYLSNLESVASKITTIRHDISTSSVNMFEPSEVDEIYCLACYPRQISFANPRRDCEVNLIGTLNALELAKAKGAKLVFASNTGIVSNPETLPVDETFPPSPSTPYDIHKLASEHLLRVYSKVHNVKTVALRFASVYGPRQRVNEKLGWRPVIPEFSTKLLRRIPPTIDGDGRQTRDFIFVKDIVKGVIAAMKSKSSDGDVFILGTNIETSILKLYRMISDLTGADVQPKHSPKKPEDIARMKYDYSKAHNSFGWAPHTRLSEGLKLTIEWLRNQVE